MPRPKPWSCPFWWTHDEGAPLKQAIREMLSAHQAVLRIGPARESDAVTLVVLKPPPLPGRQR